MYRECTTLRQLRRPPAWRSAPLHSVGWGSIFTHLGVGWVECVQCLFTTSRLAHLHSEAGSTVVDAAAVPRGQFARRPRGRWTLVAYCDERATAAWRAGRTAKGDPRPSPEDLSAQTPVWGLFDAPWHQERE